MQNCISVAAPALANTDSNKTQALTADARWGKWDPSLVQAFEIKKHLEASLKTY